MNFDLSTLFVLIWMAIWLKEIGPFRWVFPYILSYTRLVLMLKLPCIITRCLEQCGLILARYRQHLISPVCLGVVEISPLYVNTAEVSMIPVLQHLQSPQWATPNLYCSQVMEHLF